MKKKVVKYGTAVCTSGIFRIRSVYDVWHNTETKRFGLSKAGDRKRHLCAYASVAAALKPKGNYTFISEGAKAILGEVPL